MRALHCGGPSVRLRDWRKAGRARVGLDRVWPQMRDRTVIGTYRGRTAVALAGRLLGVRPGDEVLVPAYNCGTELDAVLHLGARLKAYRISDGCELDLDDLVRRRTSRTRAVYCIHFFGWDQPLADLRKWCDAEGLPLIEDCALALFSDGVSGLIGRAGDAAVYSLSKTLGFCHGGLLSLPASRAGEAPVLRAASRRVLTTELRQAAKAEAIGWLEATGLYPAVLSARNRRRVDRSSTEGGGDGFPAMPADYHFQPDLDSERGLHPAVWALASGVPVEETVRRRRSNYRQLAADVAGVPGVRLLFRELPEGVCPLSLPVLVPSRDAFVRALQSLGIAALPWWAGFHRTAIDWTEFPEACRLKRQLATLSVHQGLDERHMRYVAECVRRVAGSSVS